MKTLVAIFLLTLSLIVTAHAATTRIAAVRITGLVRINEAEVRDVLPFAAGAPFDLQHVDQGINALRRWGVFDAIQVAMTPSTDGTIINLHLEEATVVVQIDIVGNYPFLENRIRKYLSLHVGDIYTPSAVTEQVERIRTFYLEHGFVDAMVTATEENRPKENGVVLTFHIKAGPPLRYGKITVHGNHVFPNSRFSSALNTWRWASDQRLKASIRKLVQSYREQGYPRAKVEVLEKQIDRQRHRVAVSLNVVEGPRVKIRFVGNRALSDRSLKEAITILREGSFDTYEIETSVQMIREAYTARGYPNTRATAKRTILAHGTMLVTFTIDEGAAQSIKRVRVTGSKHASTKKLKAVMVNRERTTGTYGRFQPAELAGDRDAVRTALHAQGFLAGNVGDIVKTTTPDGHAVMLTVPIDEGARTLVKDVHFTGNQSVSDATLRKVLSLIPGRPYNPDALDDDRQQLLIFFADHGHPYAEVRQLPTVDSAAQTATIAYDIDAGPEITIGRILIVGDVLTSQKAIKKAMEIREGEPFSAKKVLQAQLNIRRLGPFSAVTIETIGLAEKERVVHLRVKVEEQPPFQVDLEFGYSTDHLYTGSLKFTNLNAFGWAKRNTLTLTAGRELSRVELGWLDPRFFNSSFEMSTTGWVQHQVKPAFDYIQLGGALGWFRRFHRFGLLFRLEFDRNYFVDGNTAAGDAASLRNNNIVRTATSLSYDSRDSFSDPRRGVLTIGGVDLFNEIRGNQANFAKFSLSGEADESPFRWVTLANAARFHRLQALGENVSIPSNELLFLGGDDTIRGFGEDSLGPQDGTGHAVGGRVRWIINEELRFRITKSFSFTTFYDAGQLDQSFRALNLHDVRNSAGAGLRYLTPVGPIRADYGVKIDRRAGETFGRFHLTFGYVF